MGDLDESTYNYQGDQSYLEYSERSVYNSEFSPPATVQMRTRTTVKEKLENMRQSWFNPNSFEEKVFYDPEKKDSEPKGTVKAKLSTWRKSWFGPEQTQDVGK